MSEVRHFQSSRTIILSMLIGTGGLTYFGIVPIILGGLVSDRRLNAAQLGWTAMTETLLTAAGMMLGLKMLRASRTRWLVAFAGIIMALANAATVVAPNFSSIFLASSVAGLSQGFLVAVVSLSISYAANPARVSGAFLAVSVPLPLLLAYYLPDQLMPALGNCAGFWALAVIGLICAACAIGIRDDFAMKSVSAQGGIRWTGPTIGALFGVLLSSAGYGGAWAYIDLLGALHGLNPREIGTAISAAIAGQFAVSVLTATVCWRLPMLKTLLAVSAIQIAIALLLLESGTPLSFTIVLTAFGLLWQGATPFATGLLAALDHSRRLAALTLPLQLVGLAIGPLVASIVAGTNLFYVLMIAAGLYALTLATYLLVLFERSDTIGETLQSVEID